MAATYSKIRMDAGMVMKAAVAYVRCSTETQEDSPDQQRKAILDFASTKGYEVTGWYIDFGKSGTTFEQRPEFQRLKTTIDCKPNFQAVICYDESRWGRAIDAEENTYWRVHFRKFGVDVVLVKTSVDRTNEFAPMLSAFEGVQASQYSKKLSELTLRGAKNNGIYSNGGTAPYGYQRIAINTKTGNRRLLQAGEWSISGQEKVCWALGDPEEINVVKMIFQMRHNGVSLFLITKSLNDRSIPCPKRGRWRNKDQKWSTVTVRTILENPTYYGARVYNRNSMSKIQAQQKGMDQKHGVSYPHWRNDRSEWLIEEGAHEAIITKELWQEVNNLIQTEMKKKSNGYMYKGRYLLTGLIKCSRCGFPFQGCSSGVDGKKYEKYIDGGWKNKGVCSHLGIRKSELEDFALQAIKETLSHPLLIREIEDELELLLTASPSENNSEIERLEKLLVEAAQKAKNITDAIEQSGGIQSLFVRLKEIEAEAEALKTKLSSLKRMMDRDDESQKPNPLSISQRVAEFVLDFESRIHTAPIEDQKDLIRKIISQIIVDREKEVVRFYVRRVPAVSPEIEDLFKNRRGPSIEIASPRSSGGRT
ncbi:MAG: recombinase family protein [Ignavibacteria bacterium]|nr:recombinase family protein [Ignavibacteria bacterium]